MLLLCSRQVMSNSFVTPRTVALQAPLSMGFPRQEYWSVLPFPSPGDLPNPGIDPMYPALAGRLPVSQQGSPSSACAVKSLSRVRLFVTPGTVVYQAPQSMGFSRLEYWSGLPFPSPGDLSNLEIEPRSPALQVDSLPAEAQGKPITI